MFSKIKRVFKKDLTDQELDEKIAELNLEKKDFRAMIIAGLLTLMPAVILIAIAFYAVIYLLFM